MKMMANSTLTNRSFPSELFCIFIDILFYTYTPGKMPVQGGGLSGGRGVTRGLASATAAIATATVTFPEEDACKLPPILPGLTACLQHRPMWTYDSAQVLATPAQEFTCVASKQGYQ